MSDIATTASSTTWSVDNLNDQFTVQRASLKDLPAILAIYNQSIAGKQATANLAEVTCEERAAWFEEHLNSPTRPIYVVKAASNHKEQSVSPESLSIVAWGSFSDLYARTAYHISTEISIYLDKASHGRGWVAY